MTPLHDVAKDMLAESILWAGDKLPFTAHLQTGHPKVVLVAGENCSGKSFLVEGLLGWGQSHYKTSPISVSIRERTGSGTSEMAHMRRAMMFGDEGEHSTGATSSRVVATAFRTARARAEDDKKAALLVLDEPELGLSEGYARAMGAYLAQLVGEMPELFCGLAVVSHSRALAKSLAEALGQAPTFLKLGTASDFQTWLDTEEVRTVEELLALPTVDIESWRNITRMMEALKKERDQAKPRAKR